MGKRSKSYKGHLIEKLRDPSVAAAYLKAAAHDPESNQTILMRALGDVVDSLGIGYVSELTGLNRQNLHRMLSGQGNPRYSTLTLLLKALGLRLAFEAEASSLSEGENALNFATSPSISNKTFEVDTTFSFEDITISEEQEIFTSLNEMEENGALSAAA